MKLKSMELIGFKSFAQDTKINFPDGLTEIVGPNGSGKSNVIEAIRWALGEQSAKRLRSSKMSDVIFSGSKGHPALNRAKVTLVFDNRDHWIQSHYSELKVARKIYRNGDSYYYLNGKECRLHDIQNLFMNSGIGAGSFSIISQGQVEQIFRSKPQDRRFMVETAAGIYRYKAQKRTAQQKIKATDDNATRVADLVHEYQRQLKHLGGQRAQAKKYLAKRRRYRDLANQRLVLQWHSFRRRTARLSQQLNHRRAILDQVNFKVAQLQHRQRRARRSVKVLQHRSDQVQERLVSSIQQADNFNNQRELALQKLAFRKKSDERIQNQLSRLRHLIGKLTARINNYVPIVKQLSRQTVQLKVRVKKLAVPKTQEKMRLARQRVKRLRNQYIKGLQRSAQVDNQIHDDQRNRQTLTVRSRERKRRLNYSDRLIRQYRIEYQRRSGLIGQLKRRSEQVSDQINGQTDLINRKRGQLRHDQMIYNHRGKQVQTKAAQRSGLMRLMSNHSNLRRGERNLLKFTGQDSKILGPVAKFIQVPGRYVKAIETTLKSQLQQIIVTTPQVARRAIAFLNARRLGRVTLLPLHDVAKRWISRSLIRQSRVLPGLIGVASKLVTMPRSMNRVKSHLLGNVLVAKDLRSAIQISHNLRHRYRVVTLAGEVVNAGGAITGGRGRYEYHGVLSQKYELRRLQSQLQYDYKDLNSRYSGLTRERQHFHHLEKRLLQYQRQAGQNRQKLIAKTGLQKRVAKEIKQQQRERQAVKLSFDHGSRDSNKFGLVNLKRIHHRIQKSLQKNERVVKRLEVEISQYQDRINSQRQQYQSQRAKLIRNRGKLLTLKRQVKTDHQTVSHNQVLVRRLMAKRNQTKLLIRQLQKRLGTTNSRVNQTAVNRIKAERDHDQRLLMNQQGNLKKLAQPIYRYQNLLVKRKTAFNRLKFSNHKVIQQLNLIADQFRKRGIQVQKRPLPWGSLAVINVKLQRVKRGIKRLGIVNLKSISEFTRVHRRYSFLHRQLADLIQAQHRLSKAMNNMNATIKTRFKDTFDQINRAFHKTYTDIFKGGRAKLKMTDPRHLLTTGINIMAQPPGKRYRSMELLSGGERALTAIALLFAVIRIKPVPFCILDEAESALDLVNVSRFAQYISRLKRQTQFIVITHRKETMLYADHLYGITMQQSGISTVISVNLDRIKKER